MKEGFPKEIKYVEKGDTSQEERDVNIIMENVKVDSGRVLEKIRSEIDNHQYGAILGIDGGGRVPALVLGKTINNIYESRKQEKIKTFFLAGLRSLGAYGKEGEKLEQLKEYFGNETFQTIKNKNEKILIVEDVVVSGESLKLILNTLQSLQLQYEIATQSFFDSSIENNTYSEGDITEMEEKLGSKIHYGEYGGISKLYGSKQMQGVHKSPDNLFSKPLNIPVSKPSRIKIPPAGEHSFEFVEESQNKEILRYTRNLVSKISEELTEEYLKQK